MRAASRKQSPQHKQEMVERKKRKNERSKRMEEHYAQLKAEKEKVVIEDGNV